jgi:MinD superfamily P-loop ATPase
VILSIASGKGGTGKTSVAVNLALSLGRVLLLDCDVEEPNAHLLLHPKVIETKPVYVWNPTIDEQKCNYCGKCAEFCQFNALFVTEQQVLIFSELCTSCGGCEIVCPQKAIHKSVRKIGTTQEGSVNNVDLIFGQLKVGEPMAIPIIKAVKNLNPSLSKRDVIIDSPPGTSCPFIEAVSGSDFCLLVTEPTPFGLYDLKIAVEVLNKLEIPYGVAINKAGIGDRKVHIFCKETSIPILLEIPYDRRIAELYSVGKPFVQKIPEWRSGFRELFTNIQERISV